MTGNNRTIEEELTEFLANVKKANLGFSLNRMQRIGVPLLYLLYSTHGLPLMMRVKSTACYDDVVLQFDYTTFIIEFQPPGTMCFRFRQGPRGRNYGTRDQTRFLQWVARYAQTGKTDGIIDF